MTQLELAPKVPQVSRSLRFDGPDVEPEDTKRLTGHLLAVFLLMQDGRPRTLREIASEVGCSEASASARLRDLRKDRFGAHDVSRRRVGGGIFLYSMVVP